MYLFINTSYKYMRTIKKGLLYGAIFLILFIAISIVLRGNTEGQNIITIQGTYEIADVMEVYYSDTETFDAENMSSVEIEASESMQNYAIVIPEGAEYLRFDFGSIEGNEITISAILFETTDEIAQIDMAQFITDMDSFTANGILVENTAENQLNIVAQNWDPHIVVDMEYFENGLTDKAISMWEIIEYTLAFIAALFITFFIYRYVFLSDIYAFLKDIIRNRSLLLSLAVNDFKVKFAGSYFGIIWAFIQPICTIAVFWFVFELGFRSGAVSDVPFALWLSVGLVPWFFFSDAWNGATSTFMEYSYLVKKVVFKIEILPIVKLLSSLFVHLFFILFLCFLFMIKSVPLTVNVLSVFYYMICLSVFIMGISFITSSIVVFFKDLTQIIGIILQFGMWLSPIMWQPSVFSDRIINLMRFNPMFYIIEGYRSCFIASEVAPTFDRAVYFWVVTILMFLLGVVIFRRLKPHFADVL